MRFGKSKIERTLLSLGRIKRVQWELTPSTGSEIAQFEVAESFAMQRQNRRAEGGKHSAHLMITTLDQREFGFARCEQS